MMNTHPYHRPEKSRHAILKGAIIATLAAGILVTSAGVVGAAAEGCGSTSYGFTGTRMINDGISDHAGPFTIALPAGTYDITMLSNDNHPSADYQVEQTQEQWYFTLDNGYVSPPTNDVPADQTTMITSVGAVELEAATSISVHHLGEGGVNSVNVECIGFTPSDVEVAGPATTAPATTAPPKNVVAPTTTEDLSVAPPSTIAPTTTAAAAIDPPSTEVQGAVETPAITALAVTGGSSGGLVALGLSVIAFGLACLHVEHKVSRAASRT